MTTIPALAFTNDASHDFDRAAYFALASCFPSPLIPAIAARAAAAAIPAYPARSASALIPANPSNPAIPAGALFKNSPAIAAGAAVPAFPPKAATSLVPAVTAITGVAAVPAKAGIASAVLDLTKYESTETLSKFTVFVPCNLTLEAMYNDRSRAVGNWVGAGNITRVIADGVSIAPIAGVDTLEKLLYHYAKEADSGATVERVTLGGNTYFKITREIGLNALPLRIITVQQAIALDTASEQEARNYLYPGFASDPGAIDALNVFFNEQINLRSGLSIGSLWFDRSVAAAVKRYIEQTDPQPDTYVGISENMTTIGTPPRSTMGLFTYTIARYPGVEPIGS